MMKPFEGKLSLKFFAIALAVMMTASVLPAALAGQPVDCDHGDCHDCEHAHECADAHSHETCACQHGHHHDEVAHESPSTLLAAGNTILSEPLPPKTSGFPVWLDQSQTAEDGTEDCGHEPDVTCPGCTGGWVTCTHCGGMGDVSCPTCGGSGEEMCGDCGGIGWEDCWDCGGSGDETCWDCGGSGSETCGVCGGTGDLMCSDCGGTGCASCGGTGYITCYNCGGIGWDPCMNCGGSGTVSCMSCGGMGGWNCFTCGGVGTWSCTNCGGSGDITCPTCTGSMGWTCTDCGGDGLIDLNHRLAQTFLPTAGQVEKLRLRVSNSIGSGELHVSIWSTSGGIPSSQISDIVAIRGEDVGAAMSWVDVIFLNDVRLNAGIEYAIVLSADSYHWSWASGSANPYAGGTALSSSSPWAAIPDVDMVFETYLTTPHTKVYDIWGLQAMQNNLTGNYALMNDIDASETAGWNGGEGFIPVGNNTSPFTGTLTGNFSKISSLHIDRDGNYQGLFGQISSTAKVENLNMENVYINALQFRGAIAGDNMGGTIRNCSSSGTIAYASHDAGGIVGRMTGGLMDNCSSTCTVTSTDGTNIGGLVGQTGSASTITNSWSMGDVQGIERVGGFVGIQSGDGTTITGCFATGDVTANDVGGGFAGRSNNGADIYDSYATGDVSVVSNSGAGGFVGNHLWTGGGTGIIQRCYATGNVEALGAVGGFVGTNTNGPAVIYDCYATGNATGSFQVGGFVGSEWDGAIERCYSTGSVTGTSDVGGFAGWSGFNFACAFLNNYWDKDTSGTTVAVGNPQDPGDDAGITGNTTAQLLQQSTYTGFNFDTVWWSVNASTRPFLRMEYSTEIRNSHQLQMMQMDLAADYTLANDIDLSDITEPSRMWGTSTAAGSGFMPVGNFTKPFKGGFDGSGHIISNLYINRTATQNVGLFGYSDATASLTNIILTNAVVRAQAIVGGLVGSSFSSYISNCHVEGTVTAIGTGGNGQNVGGLVGTLSGSASDCRADVSVSNSDNSIGGLVGYMQAGTLTRCIATGDVSTPGQYAGGLVGFMSSTASVTQCSATGTVQGSGNVGGLVGWSDSQISNCTASGDVSGTENVGGLIGRAGSSTITHSHAEGNVTASVRRIGGLVGLLDVASQMSFCYATGNVTGPTGNVDTRIGGAVGDMDGNSGATQCYATGNVLGGNYVGGFVGRTHGADATNCYARGSVTGNGWVGGFAGIHQTNADDIIQYCYSTGHVTGGSNTGGFCGMMTVSPVIADSYWDTQTSGVAGSAGGVGKTTAEMMTQSTFTNWDFATTWGILENQDYPVLKAFYQADLEISMEPSKWMANVGPESLGYEVRVENHGPDLAFDMWISVLLPGEMSVYSTSPPATTIEGQYVNWTGGAMPSGQIGYVYLMVNIDSFSPTLTAEATVSSTTGDPGEYPNHDTVTVNVNRHPVASPDSYATNEDTVLIVPAPGLLGNDTDPDGHGISVDSLNYTGTLGAVLGYFDGSFEYDPTGSATLQALALGETMNDYFNYTIHDGHGGFSTAMVTITVTGVNDPPVIITADVTAANVGILYSVDYDANDPEGDALTWSRVTNATWLSINATTGVLSGTPTATGTFWVNVSVSDGALSDWSNFTLTVTHPNRPPVIITDNVISAYIGTPYSVDYDATDADGDALTWSLTTDAAWLDINAVTGALTGTPLLSHVGTFSVNVSVSDGKGGSDFTVFTLTVINNNRVPVIITANVLTAKVGVLYSVDYNATDADGDTLTWARQTNATWLSINAATGVLSGTPTAAGTFWVNVTVSDGNGGLAWRYFTLTVSPADPVDDDDDDTVSIIIGPVVDASGTPIAGASVSVTVDNQTYYATTGADGNATVTLPDSALGQEISVTIATEGYQTQSYTTNLSLDGTLGKAPNFLWPSDLGEDDQRYDYTWMFIVLVLVIVLVIAAVWWFRPKAPKPGKFDPQPASPEEEPPNFNPGTVDPTKVEPSENIAEDGAVTYVESQTPYDRLG